MEATKIIAKHQHIFLNGSFNGYKVKAGDNGAKVEMKKTTQWSCMEEIELGRKNTCIDMDTHGTFEFSLERLQMACSLIKSIN